MLNPTSLASYVNIDAPAFIGQCLLEISLKTKIKPNPEPEMNKDDEIRSKSNYSKVALVNKIYEMHKGTLCESYFDISDIIEARDMMDDYALNMGKSLILVIEDNKDIEEVFYSAQDIQNCVKLIISFNQTNHIKHYYGVPQINTNSVKEAVNIAYTTIGNGESIMFAHVDDNFDFFQHVDFL